MTVAVATPFNMDEQAFLQTMDRLIERFDRYSSGRCFADLDRIRLEHDMEGPLSLSMTWGTSLRMTCSAARHGR